MWQVEPLRNRVFKGKGESRNTRRLDKNEVSDNEPSDKDEKHTFSLTTNFLRVGVRKNRTTGGKP